jgi:hypothetical protein
MMLDIAENWRRRWRMGLARSAACCLASSRCAAVAVSGSGGGSVR